MTAGENATERRQSKQESASLSRAVSKTALGSRLGLNREANAPEDTTAASTQRIYENTYRTEPERRILEKPCRDIVKSVMDSAFQQFTYDSSKATELSKQVSADILKQLKDLKYTRYKFVIDVIVTEQKGQGLRIATRALTRDTDLTVTYECHNVSLDLIYRSPRCLHALSSWRVISNRFHEASEKMLKQCCFLPQYQLGQ